MELLVVADDLTGALDTAVQLARQGTRAFVTTGPMDTLRGDLVSAPVLVADTDTRNRDSVTAYRTVAACVSRGVSSGARVFYKKTDSTLRGNIGAELDAMMSACQTEYLVFAPALPANGRTTEDGVQHVHGVPVSKTEFARDALSPVRESRVDRLVAAQTERPVRSLAPGEVPKEPRGIAVYDAVSEEDLRAVAESYRNSAVTAFAGCAGFAQYLPRLVELPQCPVGLVGAARRLLVVSGSRSSVSLRQVAWAEERGVGVMKLGMDAARKPRGAAALQFLRDALRILADHDTFVVAAPATAPEAAPGLEHAIGAAGDVAHGLGAIAAAITAESDVDAVAVFGGDTLRGVMAALEVDALEPVEEIAPGVVVSRPVGVHRPKYIVSKAGGFGASDMIFRIRNFLLEGERR